MDQEEWERMFKAPGLTRSDWNRIEDARRAAEKALDTELTNKEFLMLLVNDTSPKWRKGK